MLFEKIKNETNLLIRCVEEVKESDLPLFILGGALLGRRILKYCLEHGVRVSNILVNEKYLTKGETIAGVAVEALEERLPNVEKCNLIVAIGGYKTEILEEYKEHLNKVYVLDLVGMMVLGEWSALDYRELLKRKSEIDWLETKLQDNKSIEHLAAFINQRLIGNAFKEEYDDRQYFDDEILNFTSEEVFVDCGAYIGDTIEGFFNALHRKGIAEYRKIFAFEADKETAEKLVQNTKDVKRLTIFAQGVSDKNETLRFQSDLGSSSAFTDNGNDCIETVSLDVKLEGETVTFVKMDVEGFELAALRGMEKIIKTQKPKLAICIYHKPYDFMEISKYLLEVEPEYKLYVRNYSSTSLETVLYATL